MSNPRAEIARERRRQVQVRKAFEAALARKDSEDPEFTDFYLACAEYIVFSMDRLHDQDQVIHDLLKERIPATDTDAHQRLAVLNERQGKSRALMKTFRQGMERLKQAGQAGIQIFTDGAKKFVENFTALLAPKKNPFHKHTDELFTDSDWIVIAGVTDDSLAREEALFIAVQKSAPGGIDPDQMTVEHS